MALSQTSVLRLYTTVIDDVISSVRDAFLDEGVDEQVLQELKHIWTTKMMASKAVEISTDPPEAPPPNMNKGGSGSKAQKNAQANGTKVSKVQRPNQQIASEQNGTSTVASAAPNSQTNSNAAPNTGNAPAPGSVSQVVSGLDPNKMIPLQITLPGNADTEQRVLTIQMPGSAIQNNQLSQMLTGPIIQSIMSLPPQLASSVLQQHVDAALQNQAMQNSLSIQKQLDGADDHQPNRDEDIDEEDVDRVDVIGEEFEEVERAIQFDGTDLDEQISVSIRLPTTSDAEPQELTIHLPRWAIQDHQIHRILSEPVIESLMGMPAHLANNTLQRHVDTTVEGQRPIQNTLTIESQVDGAMETTDDEASEISDNGDDGDDDDDIDKEDEEDIEGEGGAEEEPLNSEDDVTDEDASDLFDTDNVIVCQYDKITRSRNKWKFYLKDGIMNIAGKDYVFQKSNGDAEW